MWWLAVVACGGSAAPVLPRGDWTLTGAGVLGVLTDEGGCRLGLWGPTWGTPASQPLACTVERDGDSLWLRLPFETGSSEGEASLRLSLDARVATLPLGLRDGEHEVTLRLSQGAPSLAEQTQAAAATATALTGLRTAWQVGSFRVQAGDALVGEVQFRADQAARVGFYDVSWMTDGVVEALPLDEGPDLVLVFDAEPSLDGDPSVLRINRPTNAAVVPLGLVPSPVEKAYRLVPGMVAESERQEARAMAAMASGQRELEVGLRLATALAEAASVRFFTDPGEVCPALEALDPSWPALLAGYDVTLVREGDGCGVRLEPTRVQHGRRLAAHVGADGTVRESVLRGL